MTRSGFGWVDARVPDLVRWLGVLLAILLLEELVPPAGGSLGVANVGVIGSTAPFVVVFVYGSYWLERSELGPVQYPRLLAWCLAGVGTSVALNLVVMLANPPAGPRSAFGWLRLAVAAGGAIGLVVGAIEGRTIERGRRAERNAVRAEMAEERSEWLDYVNSLLRHEVLNTTQIVEGNVSLVLDEHALDAKTRDRLETVREQNHRMATVVDDLRAILDATRDADLEPVDLSAMVREEVGALRDAHDDVEVDVAVPDDVVVAADPLLRRVVSNLLSNAVEHNDGSTPRVRVALDPGPDAVTVVVADDGPGIPEPVRRRSFDGRPGDGPSHGFGLDLVARLVDRYDGSIELTETGPDGTTVTVRLPLLASAGDADDRVETVGSS